MKKHHGNEGEKMNLEAAAVLAMNGYDVDYEIRSKLLNIIHCYEQKTFVLTDCTGCIWKTEIGCTNEKICQREILIDRYQNTR